MSEQQPVISQALALVVESLNQQQILPIDWVDNSTISRTKDQAHGDFASSRGFFLAVLAAIIARLLAKSPCAWSLVRLRLPRKTRVNWRKPTWRCCLLQT
jgi:hypothetical protein